MAVIEGFKLLNDAGSEPTNNQEIAALAIDYNRNSHPKIAIYKSFQEIRFSINSNNCLEGRVKGIPLDEEVIEQIIEHRYAVMENRLFFFADESIGELKMLSQEVRPLQISRFLRQLPEGRKLSSEEIQTYLMASEADNQFNSRVELTIDFYDYQKRGVAWLDARYDLGDGGILADDMGLGKTAQVIGLITNKLRSGSAERILIVVPNSLIANWLNEFTKFTKGLKPHVQWGKNRVGFINQLKKFNIVITTYATVVNDLTLLKQIFFDIAVFDEASLLKNPVSQRTVAIGELSYGCAVAITGTPFENSMMDLWSISNLIRKEFLGKKDEFMADFVNSGIHELTESDIELVEEQLRPILLRRMKNEVLKDLPEKIDIHKPLTMTDSEQAGYKKIEDQIRLSLDDKHVAFALISELRKYTTHPLLSEGGLSTASFELMVENSSKFAFLSASLDKVVRLGDKALVFANHVQILDKFLACFTQKLGIPCFKIDGSVAPQIRQTVIDQFSAVDGPALIFLNPITAGMGLNITSANHVFHYSRQWNPALEDQATARAYRNGQSLNVNVYYLYYSNSIEQTIHERIMVKSQIAEGVVRKTQICMDEDQLILDLFKTND